MLRCSRVEQDWPIDIPAGSQAIVKFKVHAVNPGPIALDLAFWSAEGNVLHHVPLKLRGRAD